MPGKISFRSISYWQLCLIGAGFIGCMAWIARDLVRQGGIVNAAVLIFFTYTGLRIVHEFTLNRHQVPLVTSGFLERRKIVETLRKNLPRADGRIVDLGSGRGGLTCAISRAFPRMRVTGVENAFLPYVQSVLRARLFGRENLEHRRLDFWSYDCSAADAVVMYLSGKAAGRMGRKLWKELKPGALVVSHTFQLLGDWTPAETIDFRSPFPETFYLYRR